MSKKQKKSNLPFILILILMFILIIGISVGIIMYTLSVSEKNKTSEANKEIENTEKEQVEEKNNDILIDLAQTSYYSPDTKKYNKFIIKNKADLKAFRVVHPLSPEIKDEFLKDRTIFILLKQEGSGSTKHNFLNASIKNNQIHFNIITEQAEIGTMDMATWYFIASVPNETLEGLNLKGWLDPKEVQKKVNVKMSDV